ncbi:MAG TPA: hypothetical protein VJG48_00530 [Candidatus Paceibacterota bacterium]
MDNLQGEIIRIPNTTPIHARTWYKPILMVLGVVLFGTLCFGLGRLSRIEENKPDLVVEQTTPTFVGASSGKQTLTPKPSPSSTQSGGQGAYVASKNGTKYYLPNCSGVSRINEANKVWFATKAQAEARGLTPAANCPGL